MTDDMNPDDFNDLAAEYALGVLDGEQQVQAQALQRSDPAFTAAVEAWQMRLAPLLREVSEREVDDHVWDRISGRINPANDDTMVRSLRRWRIATFGTGAIAAGLALFVVSDSRNSPVPAPAPVAVPVTQHIAQLVDPQGKPLLTIGYDPQAGTMRVSAATLGAQDRVPELWVIPGDGKPRSLGQLSAGGTSRALPTGELQQLMRDGATLAITLEQRDGIPHSAPTGAIVASGTITSI